ncbi:hypothetical protein [Paraliomyxa miuraensis]|uniref:hypothetical protein n=1 Tax=Paraliomyxa miuraensis TaxID=376150 RepID=UPI002257D922|nr:hypothetical protein [Paraliomyxa miuraensis]MCX4244882.1 hypothetical protein [Paraliomyxa miuraensis]
MTAIVGIHAGATLSLWPKLEAKDVTVSLTQAGGNLTIGSGTVVEETVLLFNDALAALGVSKGRSKIKAAVDAAIAKQIANANARLTALATEIVTPTLTEADAIKDRLMTTSIPKVGRSLQHLMDDAGISIDLRTRTVGNEVLAVATTRFDPEPAGRKLAGTIRLPKSQCTYGPPVGNDTIGYTRLPEAIETINADLAGKACSAVISGSELRRVAYLGESPHVRLGTNDPADVLPNWSTMGTVTSKGSVVDKGSHYECAFEVAELANASILELGIEPGSALAERMPIQGLDANLRARFLYATVGGLPLLLDAKGTPRNPTAITLGRANATTVDQCPTARSDGKGLSLPKGFDVALELDPETCPTCGKIDLNRNTNRRVRPGDVARFLHGGMVIEEVLAPSGVRTEQALDRLPEQRVTKAGLRPSRARGRVPKARTLPETHVRIEVE